MPDVTPPTVYRVVMVADRETEDVVSLGMKKHEPQQMIIKAKDVGFADPTN